MGDTQAKKAGGFVDHATGASIGDFERLREKAGSYSAEVKAYQAQLANTPKGKQYRLHDQSSFIARTWHKIKRFAFELFRSHTTYDEHVLAHIRDQLDHIVLAAGANKKQFKDASLDAKEALEDVLRVIDELNRQLARAKADEEDKQEKFNISLQRYQVVSEEAQKTMTSAKKTSEALGELLRDMAEHNENTQATTDNPLYEGPKQGA